MYIRKRGQFYHYEFFVNGNRYAESFNGKNGAKTATNKKEACEFAYQERRKVLDGTFRDEMEREELKDFATFVDKVYLPFAREHHSSSTHDEFRCEVLKEYFKTKRFESLIATSGMAANLAEVIHQRRTNRPLPQLNLATVSLKEVKEMEQVLRRSTIKERQAIPGLDPKRVDTLFPATLVLRRLMELVGRDELILCDKAIREGIIFDFIVRHRE